MENLFLFKIFLYIIIVFSAVCHEYLHAWMAHLLGDPTAKYAGRLTLNPLKHLDPVGTVILPLTLLFFFGGFIGWAKPVPYNPFNIRAKYGSTKVALAGPAMNLLIALVFGLVLRFLPAAGLIYIAFSWIVYINILLALFNMIPLPPLDGSKLLMDFFPRSGIIMALQRSLIGIFLAVIIATTFLAPLSRLVYQLFVGSRFLGLVF